MVGGAGDGMGRAWNGRAWAGEGSGGTSQITVLIQNNPANQ